MLKAKVIATNRVNKAQNELVLILAEKLKPFIGKKVMKANGTRTKAIAELIPTGDVNGCWLWPYSSSHSWLSFGLKTSEHYAEFTVVYAETVFSIGKVENGILTELVAVEPLRTDYTVEEIEQKRKLAQDLAEQTRQAEYACSPFGLYTH